MRIERVMRVTTAEQAEIDDALFYASLTPQEKVDLLLELRNEWTPPHQRRLERTYRLVEPPQS